MDVHPCFIILVSQPNRKLCQCHTYPISPSVEGAVLRTAQLRVYAAVHTADYIRRLDSNTHSGWWFGTWLLFFHILGIIFPTDELHHFSEGWLNHQPANNLRRCLALLNQPLGRVEIALLIQPSFLLWKNYPPSRKRFQFLWATKRSTMFWNRCALMKEVQNGRND